MNGSAETVTALRSAFDALLGIATPDRIIPTLQRALRDLLAEEVRSPDVTAPSPSKKSHSRWTGNREAWAPLREAVLAELATRGMSRRELAGAANINHATLKPSLSPRGPVPSKHNIAKLQRWLKAGLEDGAADNGHATGPVDGAVVRSKVAHDARAQPAGKLTTAQRERLAGYRQLDGETARQAGVTPEIIDEAVAGRSLAPEIIDRLVSFLQQPAA